MSASRFALVAPASRGLSLALTRQLLRTTKLPVYATYRNGSADDFAEHVLAPLKDAGVDAGRLRPLRLDLTDESSIAAAAQEIPDGALLQTAFFTGGVLYPEKQPSDLELDKIAHTFNINVVAHLLCIKHFARFLPGQKDGQDTAKWVHVSARVGSISDNRQGGWYSYRASKAALNQVVRTFDWQLKMRKNSAMCVGVHPGTMKTELSKEFWSSVEKDKLFEPEYSAEKLLDVVNGLKEEQRGRIWDYKGEEVKP